MDVKSGMGADIYEGMANAVSNACVVVCFMSEKYQQSANCMLEVKFAKQSGVGMIPVMMEGSGWRPSGWLGLITAGSLWVRLSDESQFEENIRQLYGQIQGMVGAALAIEEVSDEGVASASEAKEELERLREDLEAKAESQAAGAAVLADPSEPATIPAGVPKLPSRFQSTEQIRELTRLVLSTSASDMRMPRVGFWGMGGIGKTVTGAAIVRNEEVRVHFHAIIWLPLGQSPVIAKLQNLCHMQCTGKELSAELSSDEKKEALQQAMSGKRVLLCLDDLWEEQHEVDLNFADVSAGSKVLISTRMKALLDGGHQVEVGLPSPSDSARMLLAAAGADDSGRHPSGVSEIVDLCGRLPLALGIAGRLAASLGLVGTADWSDMIGVLKEELRESHSGGVEEGMIRASLRGLKGSAQEQSSVKSLLLLFGLVPEDTHCPLEVLLLMFSAVHPDADATLMHIRKWLRILINRSLVLGLLIDLLCTIWCWTSRLLSMATLSCVRIIVALWKHSVLHDLRMCTAGASTICLSATILCLRMCVWRVGIMCRRAWEAEMEQDAVAVTEWLGDVPQDELVLHAGSVLGVDRLSTLAGRAESRGDWWLAGRYYAVACVLKTRSETAGNALSLCTSALDALSQCMASSAQMSAQMEDVQEVQLAMFESQWAAGDIPGLVARSVEAGGSGQQ